MVSEWLTEFDRVSISSGIVAAIFAKVLYDRILSPGLSRLWSRISPFASPIGENTEEAIMREAKEMLEGWYAIRQNGEIVCDPPSNALMDSYMEEWRKPVLYIFAAKDAYEMGKRKTPQVSYHELVEKSVPSDPEFLSINPRSHWIDFYEGEAVELDSGREVFVYDSDVDREMFELLDQDCEILQGMKWTVTEKQWS